MSRKRKQDNHKRLKRRAKRLERSRWNFTIAYRDDNGVLQTVERSVNQKALKDFIYDVQTFGSLMLSGAGTTFRTVKQVIDMSVNRDCDGSQAQRDGFIEHVLKDIGQCLTEQGQRMLMDGVPELIEGFFFDRTFIRPDEILNVLPDGVVPASIEYINAEGLADYQQIIREESFHFKTKLHFCSKWGDPLARWKEQWVRELKTQTTSYVLAAIIGKLQQEIDRCDDSEVLEAMESARGIYECLCMDSELEKNFSECRAVLQKSCSDVGVNFDEEPLESLSRYLAPSYVQWLHGLLGDWFDKAEAAYQPLQEDVEVPDFEQWFELGQAHLISPEGDDVAIWANTSTHAHHLSA